MAPTCCQPPHFSCSCKEGCCAENSQSALDMKQPHVKRKTDTKQHDCKRKTGTMQYDSKSECCSCEDCTEPKTCLYYDNRKKKQPAGFCGLMLNTQSQQESAVQEQRNAYITPSKGSYSAGSKRKPPAKCTEPQLMGVYGFMVDTLSRQESAVEEQKVAYLPQSKQSRASKDSFGTKGSKKSNSPAKRTGSRPADAYGLMIETMSRQESAVEQQKCAYLPQSKRSKTNKDSVTNALKKSKSPAKRTGSQQLSGIYGLMVDTLSRQESAVEEQKGAYLPRRKESKASKDSCCIKGLKKTNSPTKRTGSQPSGIYGLMVDTLSRQESAVKEQKCAYLPQNKRNKASKDSCCTKVAKKSNSLAKRTGSQPSGIYGLMIDTLSRQESAVEEQKGAYLPRRNESIGSCCSKCSKISKPPTKLKRSEPSGVYAVMIDVLSHQESAVEVQKYAYLTPNKDKKSVPSQDNCCAFIVTKGTSKSAGSDELNAISSLPSSITELLKSITDYKSTYSIQSKRSTCKCNNISLDRRTITPSGSNIGVITSTESPCTCPSKSPIGSNNKQVYNVNQITSDTNSMSYKRCSECSQLAKKNYEPPKYFAESKRYKPTKSAQELFRNIFQTQGYEYQNEWDESDTYSNNTMSESPGYVFELPKHTHNVTLQNDCHSNKSTTNNLKLSGYELQDYFTTPNTREPAVINTGEVNVNRCQVKWITTDSNCMVLKAHCHDDDLAGKDLFDSCGYVVEVPKDTDKKKCSCSDNLLESSGYVLELPKVTEKKKCSCNDSANLGSDKRASANDLRNSKETNNTQGTCKRKCKHKHTTETPTEKRSGSKKLAKCTSSELVVHALPKHSETSQKSGCGFSKSDKNRLAPLPSTQELPCCCTPHAQQKSSEYPESESEHQTCDMKFVDVPGYVFEMPEYTRNSCGCTSLRKNSIQSDTQNICQNTEAHKSSKSSHATNIYTMLCNNIIKKQAETIEELKSIYLPGKGNKSNAMNFQLNILEKQAHNIKVLKHTYMPQKKFEFATTCCSPRSNLTEPSDEGIKKLSAKEFGGSIESDSSYTTKNLSKCDLLTRIRDVYEACSCKICECKPTKTDAHECQKLCEYDGSLSPILSYEMDQWQACGCKPCDCAECNKSKNIQQCLTLSVAPVGREQNVSPMESTCSPCSCFEGGIVYPLDSHISHVVNEMSTSMTHALCRCEVCLNENCDRNGVDACSSHKHNKIMSKPVEPDTHDFDIRPTKVVYDKSMFRQVGKNSTMAMCVAVPNRYPPFDDRPNNTQTCRCKECECIYCVAQKYLLNSSRLMK